MTSLTRPQKVLLTGATGFVGRHVARELVARGYTPVCLVRDADRIRDALKDVPPSAYVAIRGDLDDKEALAAAASQAQAAIHLVGIIMDSSPLARLLSRKARQRTFEHTHVEGTRHMIAAAQSAGIRRFVHMSALGTRPDAVSEYHQSKWRAEELLRSSSLAWTIFRPSVIHGPDGEFMELMRTFVTGLSVPVIPYFGRGENKLQPVSVLDVAHCFVACLDMDATVGQVYCLGGPQAYSWKELYQTCRELIPGAFRHKPIVGLPIPMAKLIARTVMRTPLVPAKLKFNSAQVQMSQEDSFCDVRPAEQAFGIRMRDFRFELAQYADQIR